MTSDQRSLEPDPLEFVLAELLSTIPLSQAGPRYCGASDSEIDLLQSRIGVQVPMSLRRWLRRCNGIQLNTIDLLGTKDIEPAYGYRPVQWRALAWIPVAGDGCGNYYLLSTNDRGEPVYFCDTIAFTPDLKAGVYAVASDFWHFLAGALSTERGGQWWPFDKQRVLARDPNMAGRMLVSKAWEE